MTALPLLVRALQLLYIPSIMKYWAIYEAKDLQQLYQFHEPRLRHPQFARPAYPLGPLWCCWPWCPCRRSDCEPRHQDWTPEWGQSYSTHPVMLKERGGGWRGISSDILHLLYKYIRDQNTSHQAKHTEWWPAVYVAKPPSWTSMTRMLEIRGNSYCKMSVYEWL